MLPSWRALLFPLFDIRILIGTAPGQTDEMRTTQKLKSLILWHKMASFVQKMRVFYPLNPVRHCRKYVSGWLGSAPVRRNSSAS